MDKQDTVMALIAKRQEELGITDEQLADAIGYKPGVIALLKLGSMRLPINKVAAAADCLGLDRLQALKAALVESSPSLWEVLEPFVPLGQLTPTEINLLTHIRKLGAGRQAAPMVIDGGSVIALVVTS